MLIIEQQLSNRMILPPLWGHLITSGDYAAFEMSQLW